VLGRGSRLDVPTPGCISCPAPAIIIVNISGHPADDRPGVDLESLKYRASGKSSSASTGALLSGTRRDLGEGFL